MMRFLTYTFISLLFLLGCKPKQERVGQSNKPKLEITHDSLIIPIDSDMNPAPDWFFYHKIKSNGYISFLNKNNGYEIILINIATRKTKKIKIDSKGPNGCGNVAGYRLYNFDSIFITPSIRRKIYLVNNNGIVQETFDISNCVDCKNVSPFASTPTSKLKNKGGNLIIPQNIMGNWQKTNREDIMMSPLFINFNIETRQSRMSSLFWPEIKPNIQHSLRVKYSSSSKHDIFSFAGSHNLYILKNKSKLKKKLCKSRYIDEFIPNGSIQNLGELFRWYCRNPYYGDLAYDPFRQVYYRFVYPGINVSKGDHVKKLAENKKVFSIMLLNKNLEVLSEKMMPEDTFKFNSYFINELGLFLFENHIENPDFDEKYFKFRKVIIK